MTQHIPVTPDRFDTRPITLDDDANRAAMRQFARNALASGHPVEVDGKLYRPRRTKGREVPALHVGEEGDPAELEDATLPKIAAIFDLDPSDFDHEIRIKTIGGTVVPLRLRATVASARKVSWYQQRLAALDLQLSVTEDEEEADRLLKRSGELQEAMLRLSFPDMPSGLLGELEPVQFTGLMAFMERAGREIQQQTERVRSKLLGEPAGRSSGLR